MEINKKVRSFVDSSKAYGRHSFELSKKVLADKGRSIRKKLDTPQWFSFLSEDARDLLLPAVYVMKSAAAH